jgi:hypothetical protein
MQVKRQFIAVRQRQVDMDEHEIPKRRRLHPDIAGQGRTLDDLVSSIVEEITP